MNLHFKLSCLIFSRMNNVDFELTSTSYNGFSKDLEWEVSPAK